MTTPNRRPPTTGQILEQQRLRAEAELRAKQQPALFDKPKKKSTFQALGSTHIPGGSINHLGEFSQDQPAANVPAVQKPAAVPATADTQTAVGPFRRHADAVAPRTITGKLLKFSKGEYVAGDGDETVPMGTQFVAVMKEMVSGWVKWLDNKPVEHRVGRVVDGHTVGTRDSLGDLDETEWETDDFGVRRDPWQRCEYLPMQRVDTGEFHTFTASSRGGIGALADLCSHYDRLLQTKPGCYPVIKLASASYEHKIKAYGRIKYPIFAVMGSAPEINLAAADTSTASDMDDDIPY